MITLTMKPHTTNARKVRQLKYVMRQLSSSKRSLLSSIQVQKLIKRFKKLYTNLSSISLNYKLKKTALSLALACGINTANAQITFAAPVTNPFNISAIGPVVYSLDLVDIDNDGDLDAFYGVFYYDNSIYNYSGAIYYMENIGTIATPHFAAPVFSPFGIPTTPAPGTNSAGPQFVDIDNDGDYDLFLTYFSYGTASVHYFQNTGTATTPVFASPVANAFGTVNPPFFMANFCFPDIDNDGDFDLFAGGSYSYSMTELWYQPNTGTASAPIFGTPQSNAFSFASSSSTSYNCALDFADLDHDGDLDMYMNFYDYVLGGSRFSYYENTGNITAPTFAAPVLNAFGINVGANYKDLVFGDIDADGDEDIFMVDFNGNFHYYENTSLFVPGPTIEFDTISINVNESNPSIAVTINVSNANTNPTGVNLQLVSGLSTADIGDDFVLSNPTFVLFPASSNTPQTVLIPLVNDVIVEPIEQIVLRLTNPSNNGSFGLNDTLTINIIDNDIGLPEINFDTAAFTINEAIGIYQLPLNISNPSTVDTQVDVQLLGSSTASNGNDFTFSSPITVTFPGNTSVTQTISIPINDDALHEMGETIVLGLTNVTNGGGVGAIDTIVLTIGDNDLPPELEFNTNSASYVESVGSITVDVNLSNESAFSTQVDVEVMPSSTASISNDYTFSNPTVLTFPANSMSPQSFSIPINDDAFHESEEEIILRLTNVTNSGSIGSLDSIIISLQDNDLAPELQFNNNTATYNEGVGTISVDVNFVNMSENPTKVDVVFVGTATATIGTDFILTSPTTLTFPPLSDTAQSVTIPIIDDALVESTETIVLQLTNPTNESTFGTNYNMIIDIVDNDTITKIDYVSGAETIKIYPNPFHRYLVVETEEFHNKEVNIYNSMGQLLIAVKLKSINTKLPTSTLLPGVYWIEIRDKGTGTVVNKRMICR